MRQRKDNSTVVIAVMCGVIVVIFSIIVVMLARSQSDNLSDGVMIDKNGRVIVPAGSDYLPDGVDGSWWVPADSHVLQSPRNADMTEEAALADEYDFGVILTYGTYKTNRIGEVSLPYYKVQENCGRKALDAAGIQSGGVMDEYPEDAQITQVQIYDHDGTTLCDTVFLIQTANERYLIYYGTGNFVFEAVKVEAEG